MKPSDIVDKKYLKPQYLTNAEGEQQAIIIALSKFEQLVDSIHKNEDLLIELEKAVDSTAVATSQPKNTPVVNNTSIVNEENNLREQVSLLQQHYDTLTRLFEDLRQYETFKNELERKLQTQRLLSYIDTEIQETRRQLGQLKKHSKSAELYHVPPLPNEWVENPDLFKEIKNRLLAEVTEKQRPPLVIHATSGMGKSLMAASLTQDDEIKQSFPDGIFWLCLGHETDLLANQVTLLRLLDESTSDVFDVEEGTQRLRELCATRACLIILDDVWDAQDILAFNVEGEHCQLLITTCDRKLVDILQYFIKTTKGYSLSSLTGTQSVDLFIKSVGNAEVSADTATIDLAQLVEHCDYSPLTLKLIANLAAARAPATWGELLEQLQDEEIEISDKYPRPLQLAFRMNVEALGEPGDYYLALGVFGDYLHIPQAVVLMLWNYLYHLRKEEGVSFIQELAEKGLLQIDEHDSQKYLQLHSFQHEYLQAEADLEKLHNHLLAAYRRQCGQHGWITGPNDGYFFEYLCMHLHHARRHNELKLLLMDFDWINKKLLATNAHALLSDYEWSEDKDVSIVKNTLYEAASVLHTNKPELANQLLDRLWGDKTLKENKDIQALLNQAKEASPNWRWQPHFPEG